MTQEPADASRTRLIRSLDEISADYDALLCDVWGCYHDGVAPFPSAVAALERFRAAGGVVLLLTNAPRPHAAVKRHLDGMGAPETSFDGIVSSGDATRAELASGRFGRRIHVVGPERDSAIWDGLELEHVDLEKAEAILCTGLFDDATETPEDYAELVAEGVARRLQFLCANPDIVVDRGSQRLYCAGAIAEAYARGGGETLFFGKPHPPIYALALATLREIRPELNARRVLAVGDGIATDVLGAEQADIDCLFVSGGLAAREVGDAPDTPDAARLSQYLASHGRRPRYTIGRLG